MYVLEVGWTPIYKQLKHLNRLRQHHIWRTSIVYFEHNYHINLVSLFLTLNKEPINKVYKCSRSQIELHWNSYIEHINQLYVDYAELH